MKKPILLGGIEAGGTKFLCAVADADGVLVDRIRIPTTSPEATLDAASAFFARTEAALSPIAALSIGSFGPLALRPGQPGYGSITSTPKPGWAGVDILGHFARRMPVPMALDTDVNCAAVGEGLFGSARGLEDFCYITVGTGIGVGLVIGGAPHGGANHPEAGHIRLPRAPGDDEFAGCCPFHGDCLEGLASGPAMLARWGVAAETLPDDHPAWAIAADYIAALCATLTYIVRPGRIIVGGGVLQRQAMYPRVRAALTVKLAGYDTSLVDLDMGVYIAPPTAGASAGLTGALAGAYRLVAGKWPTHWLGATP